MATLLLLLLLPAIAGLVAPAIRKSGANSMALALVAGAANLGLAAWVYFKGLSCVLPIELHGFEFAFEASGSALYLLLAAILFLPAAVYAAVHFRNKEGGGLFSLCLYISLSMINGALLSDHLGLMLFFWEGLLCTMLGMLLVANPEKPQAVMKGFALSGTADLILMLGVTAVSHVAGTGRIGEISGLAARGLGALGCACLLAGSLGKAGCFPFHAWIPDASQDSPAPFAAAFPNALYRILGGYLAARTVFRLFALPYASAFHTILIVIGLATLLIGAAFSLAQTDRRRSLAHLGIAQAGTFALALGAGVGPFGAALQIGVSSLGVAGLRMAADAAARRAGKAIAVPIAALLAVYPLLDGRAGSASTLSALASRGVLPLLLALAGLLMVAFALYRLVFARAEKGEAMPPLKPMQSFRALENSGLLDPYRWLMGFTGCLAWVSRRIEDCVSWVYDAAFPVVAKFVGNSLSHFDNGSLSRYLTLAVVGMLVVGAVFAIVLL